MEELRNQQRLRRAVSTSRLVSTVETCHAANQVGS